MSPRRLFNLIASLPDGCASERASNTTRAWTLDEHFLATLVEMVTRTNDLLAQAHFEKPRGGWPQLKPIPRPGAASADDDAPRTASPAEMRSFFAGTRL